LAARYTLEVMSAENYSIRLAKVAELRALQDIEGAAGELFLHTDYADVGDAELTTLDLLYEQCQKGMVWVAADSDDQPVGFVITLPLDGRLHLQELDVHPAHGRRGLGTRLIRAAGEWAKHNGYAALSLSTFREVAWNAPFYARLGFVVIEEAELSPGLRAVREAEARHGLPIHDRVCMRLDL
jgi:GNAT superfamily N-acetyltransferase